MIELTRSVRFCVNLTVPADLDGRGRHNTFAGWPSMQGLGAFYELQVCCRGEPDELTGYLLNISAIDAAVRELAIPAIQRAARAAPQPTAAMVLTEITPALQASLGSMVTSVQWRLTPYYSVTMNAHSADRVVMSQQFEFSASHRLHVESLGADRNREIFGKCNNPNSHGHNYRIEVAASLPIDAANDSDDGNSFSLSRLEQIVDAAVIQRFDHKHLNLDTREFAALNPSVENIAKVCHDLLAQPIASAGAKLERVTVWETEKTKCTYPAS